MSGRPARSIGDRLLQVAPVFVLLSLLAILMVPLAFTKLTSRLHVEAEDVGGPAEALIHMIARGTAAQAIAVRDVALADQGAPHRARTFAAEGAAVDEAVTGLRALAPKLGDDVSRSIDVLTVQIEDWREIPEALVAGQITREHFLGELDWQNRMYRRIQAATNDCVAQINLAEQRLRSEAERLADARLWSIAGIAMLGMLSAGTVVLLARRRDLAERDRDRAHLLSEARAVTLAYVSHDLRSPLGVIQMGCDVLDSPERSDSEVARALALMRRATQQMGNLVDDLLIMARTEAGHEIAMRLEPTDFGALVRRLCDQLTTRAGEIEIACETVDPLPYPELDADRMERALSNVLSNAVKFSPPKSQVRVVVRTVEDGIKLSISDQGPGIAPRNLRHLFEPHWQASPANIGWGLGLAIARSIILGHGGRIGVDSEVGGGTTFHVWLPLPNRPVARPLATATTELVADPPPSPSGEHPKSVVA